MDPDMVLGSPQGLDITMAPGGSEGHPDRLDPRDRVALGHQRVPSNSPAPWNTHGPQFTPVYTNITLTLNLAHILT